MSPIKRLLVTALATGFGVGYCPVAPGTVGTILGLAIIYGLGPVPVGLYYLGLVLLVLVGVWASESASRIFGKVDSGHVVIDEIAGAVVTMLGMPLTGKWLLLGFLLFRLFDIWKPPPVGWIDQQMKNGWGVMADDLMAGVYANLVLHLILWAGG